MVNLSFDEAGTTLNPSRFYCDREASPACSHYRTVDLGRHQSFAQSFVIDCSVRRVRLVYYMQSYSSTHTEATLSFPLTHRSDTAVLCCSCTACHMLERSVF